MEKEKKQFKITEDAAIVYKLRPQDKSGNWADITIREWPHGGSIDIQSDFGNYAYDWNAIGDGTFKDFLCHLDYHYFMSKASGNHGQIFSIEKSLEELYNVTMSERAQNHITVEDALICLCIIEDIELWIFTESDYRSALEQHPKLIEIIYGGDWLYVSFEKIDDPQCVAFWDIIWSELKNYWTQEDTEK